MRPEKQFLLDEVKEKIENSQALVFAKYQGLDPNLTSTFRFLLNDKGGSYKVVRKRILLKAAQSCGFSIEASALEGHIGVIFVEQDPVDVTKAVCQFQAENKEKFEVIGGRFEGRICSAKDVEEISKLPSKDEMRSQFLATLEAPMSQTLAVMEAVLTSVIYCLDNKSKIQ
ncbi:MAG: 50S ribosomal protein L10 [Chlamydiota bacterium]